MPLEQETPLPFTRIPRAFVLLFAALAVLAVFSTAAPAGAAGVRQVEPASDPCDDFDYEGEECYADDEEEEEPLTPEELVGDYYDETVGPAIFAALETTFATTLKGAKPTISTAPLGPYYVPTNVFVRLRAKSGFTAGIAEVDLTTTALPLDFQLNKKAGRALREKGKLAVVAEVDLDDPTYGAEWGDDLSLTLKGVKKKKKK